MLHSVFVHVDFQALLQPAGPTLVPVRLVHRTAPLISRLADVGPVPPNAPLEETRAAVAGVHPIVLAGAAVPAHFAGDVQNATC